MVFIFFTALLDYYDLISFRFRLLSSFAAITFGFILIIVEFTMETNKALGIIFISGSVLSILAGLRELQ